MQVALLKQSHEELWLREGHLLAMQFEQGWVCLRVLGWEPSNVKPYVLAATLAAGATLAAFNELLDGDGRRYTEPPEAEYIHHHFYGLNQPKARVYFQYPTRRSRNSLVSVERTVGGDVGYVDGDMSPYDGPFSLKSEFFTAHELYPAFQCYNPLGDAMTLVMLNLDVMRYTYQVITNRDDVKPILLGERRRRMYTVAGIDPNPASIPDWLSAKAGGKEMLDWTLRVMKGEA